MFFFFFETTFSWKKNGDWNGRVSFGDVLGSTGRKWTKHEKTQPLNRFFQCMTSWLARVGSWLNRLYGVEIAR